MPLKYKIKNVVDSTVDEMTNILFYATEKKFIRVSLDSIRDFIKKCEEDSSKEDDHKAKFFEKAPEEDESGYQVYYIDPEKMNEEF
jgi:hypothetical protein